MTPEIRARLTDVFHDVFDDDAIVIDEGTTADDIDGWDSLTHIRLMLSVEREFKVNLTASEIGKLKSVGDLIVLLVRKTNATSL